VGGGKRSQLQASESMKAGRKSNKSKQIGVTLGASGYLIGGGGGGAEGKQALVCRAAKKKTPTCRDLGKGKL